MLVWRVKLLSVLFLALFFLIGLRLFQWQVVNAEKLSIEAEKQYSETLTIPAKRGEIFSSDNFPLVANEKAYLVFSEIKKIKDSQFSAKMAKILDDDPASVSAKLNLNLFWVALAHKVSEEKKEEIKQSKLEGVGFLEENRRFYPEASMAAQLLGFVGFAVDGEDKGYFGLEGFYDRELKGKEGKLIEEKDVRGLPILLNEPKKETGVDGRSLILHLERNLQYLVEQKLKESLEKYGAKSGSVIIMEPNTGGILAMASLPSYDPAKFNDFPEQFYKNPVVSDFYEPGSIFKTMVMAAGINEDAVKINDVYDDRGPVKVDDYWIKTWNDQYHGRETAVEILERSCNTGMVWIARKLGLVKFFAYLEKLGLEEKTGIDLEEEAESSLRKLNDWGEIDLATSSFGQGIAVTPIKMIQMVAALASGGKLLEPAVVAKVKDANGKEMEIKPKIIQQVFKPQTARVLTEMMVNAVEKGEAKWAKPKGYKIAGKTGTAQVPVEGHYDKERTIASFVGFAPADNPKFVMLIRLIEPQSSPWAAETAAPLFFEISKELFNYYGIPPSQ